MCTDKRVRKYLQILKNRSNDIISRPIKLLHSFELLRGVELPPDRLKFQETADGMFDGFYAHVDIIGKRKRKEKKESMSKEALEKESEYEIMAKGQIVPFPSNWTWNFSWTKIPHPNLKSILEGPNLPGKLLLPKQRRELIEHLVAELFIYFRRGIPTIYSDLMMRKLVQDFPALLDDKSFSGYVSKN